MRKNQKEIVLEELRRVGDDGLHSFWGYKNYVPRLAAVIFDLKKEGYSITSKDNKDGSCAYFLKEDSESNINIEEVFSDLAIKKDNRKYYFSRGGKKIYLS